ncbi:MAG: ECF-type sigma factor [Planctomycetota bacterium]
MNPPITHILQRIQDRMPASGQVDPEGLHEAWEELLPLVYPQMRQIAAAAARKEPQLPQDPTELVHEAYLRLVGNEALSLRSRGHFYGACALVIRRILVDAARKRKAEKRGGGWGRVTLDVTHLPREDATVDLIELNDALDQLAKVSPRAAQLVELRFFGGLGESEAAEVLGASRRTVSGDWTMAKAWLRLRLSDSTDREIS